MTRLRHKTALACALCAWPGLHGCTEETPDETNAGPAGAGMTATMLPAEPASASTADGGGGATATGGRSAPVVNAGADAADAARPELDAGTMTEMTEMVAPPDASADDAAATESDAGAGSRPGWKLVWSDEFDGPAATPVDTTKWNLVDKGDGFGNNELQFYTPRTDNAALDGKGALVITARRETHGGRDYTSARLESNGKFELTYGRVEARLKVPHGQGIWPAFWMLGTDIGSVGWPTCGEIDIMENIGREPTTVHGSLHGPGYSGGNPLGQSYMLPDGAPFADDFHEFAVEWERDVIRFYVDDDLYQTRTPADVPNGARWVYDHAFYLLLNVAVGGQWPGSPDGTTVFPQMMTVDYVRVYARQ